MTASPDRAGLLREVACLTCGAPIVDALAGACGVCGAEDRHIGSQWFDIPQDQRPLAATGDSEGLLDVERVRFRLWDDTVLVVQVDGDDPGDMGEPRDITDYDASPVTHYLSAAARLSSQDKPAAATGDSEGPGLDGHDHKLAAYEELVWRCQCGYWEL